MNLFTLKNVKKSYGRGEAAVHALNGLNLEIGEGAFAAITGRSGSGKSTLMKVLAGLVTPESGEGYFRDEKLNGRSWKQLLEYRRKHVGIITQSNSLLDEDTVFDNIALPLQLRHVGREEIEREVTELCRTLGILEKLDACANELSGGQRQRVAIGRALITKPTVILADEPTGALDRENEENIMKILRAIHENGTALIIVTHDPEIADACDTRIEIDDGRVRTLG